MIAAKDAIATARSYIGTPYSEMDCIRLVVMVIRNSPGGVKDYRCQGTNWLWDSVNNSGKYRHLTSREDGLSGAQAGKLAFKRYGKDAEDHVGIVTGEGTLIHSSSVDGRGVVETPLTRAEGWDLLGTHRYIEVADGAVESEDEETMLYQARVITQEDPLTLRNAPVSGKQIGELPIGAIVEVMSTGDWPRVKYGDMLGYASAQYLKKIEDEPALENVITVSADVTIIDSKGNRFKPVGDWRVLIGGVD